MVSILERQGVLIVLPLVAHLILIFQGFECWAILILRKHTHNNIKVAIICYMNTTMSLWIHSWRNKNWSETFASVFIKKRKEHLQTGISARLQKDYFLSRSLHGEVFLTRQRRKWIACFQWSHEATVACDGHDILLVHGKCKTKGYVFFFFWYLRYSSCTKCIVFPCTWPVNAFGCATSALKKT